MPEMIYVQFTYDTFTPSMGYQHNAFVKTIWETFLVKGSIDTEGNTQKNYHIKKLILIIATTYHSFAEFLGYFVRVFSIAILYFLKRIQIIKW